MREKPVNPVLDFIVEANPKNKFAQAGQLEYPLIMMPGARSVSDFRFEILAYIY